MFLGTVRFTSVGQLVGSPILLGFTIDLIYKPLLML